MQAPDTSPASPAPAASEPPAEPLRVRLARLSAYFGWQHRLAWTAAILATTLAADVLVIATDVENVMIGWGTPQQRALGSVTAAELRSYAEAGEFASGSMGPKVEAAMRFVAAGGRSIITSLARIADALESPDGGVGTVIRPQ